MIKLPINLNNNMNIKFTNQLKKHQKKVFDVIQCNSKTINTYKRKNNKLYSMIW